MRVYTALTDLQHVDPPSGDFAHLPRVFAYSQSHLCTSYHSAPSVSFTREMGSCVFLCGLNIGDAFFVPDPSIVTLKVRADDIHPKNKPGSGSRSAQRAAVLKQVATCSHKPVRLCERRPAAPPRDGLQYMFRWPPRNRPHPDF